VSLGRVRARLAVLDGRELADGTEADRDRAREEGFASRADTVSEMRHRDLRPRLSLLQAAGLLVLLLGVVNVAGLLTARAAARRDEVSARVALGATRGRLVQQWVTESALYTVAGWGAGLLVAWALLRDPSLWAGAAGGATDTPLLSSPLVLTASLTLAGLAALFLGVLTGVQVAAMHGRVIGAGPARGATPTRGARRLVARLASGQTAVAVVLLGLAGLLLLSYARVVGQDLGYDPDALVMMRVGLPEDDYPDAKDRDRFAERLQRELAGIPDVSAVARTSFVPTFGHPDVPLYVSGRDDAPARVAFTQVSPGYFEAMGIPILQGRGIRDGDTAWWREAVVIDRRLARRVFGDEDPVGKRVRLGPTPANPRAWPVVVGVAAEVHHTGWDETGGLPMVYRPIAESGRGEFSVVVRSRREPTELLGVVQQRVRLLDPRVVLFRLGPVQAFLAESILPRRALLNVVGAFALIAVLLTVVGVAGVLSFDVASRTRELGVRLALGAQRRELAWLVLRQALLQVAWGLVPGLVALYAAGHLASGLLYQTSGSDSRVYLAVTVIVLTVGLVAGYLPARRTVRLDPVDALRVS
jgi:putative ABC transport system permease protein